MLVAGGLLAGAVSKAHKAMLLIDKMAINTVETKLNAKANTQTAGSLALSGKSK